MHTAEQLVPEPRSFEVQTKTEKLKKYKSQCTAQIPAEMIQAQGITHALYSKIHKRTKSIWNNEKFPD
jgi:hypothetical protein